MKFTLIKIFQFGPVFFEDKTGDVKSLQQNQSGNNFNWNEYKTKDLAIGIGTQAGYAAIQGALIGVGMNLVTKVWNDEEIKVEKVVKDALKTGADFAINVILAGALKVGVEKDIVKFIPKGTPESTIANILYIGIQNVQILAEGEIGKLTLKEVLNKIGVTTVSTATALAAGGIGTLGGEIIGTIFGPAGTFVGGYVGGIIGYIAGEKVGETVTKGIKKVKEVVKKVTKEGHF